MRIWRILINLALWSMALLLVELLRKGSVGFELVRLLRLLLVLIGILLEIFSGVTVFVAYDLHKFIFLARIVVFAIRRRRLSFSNQ